MRRASALVSALCVAEMTSQPAAAGWYRVKFIVPDRLGKFPMPKNGYTCGVEHNMLGAWETYTYVNGKPAGLWSKEGMQMAANQPPTFWMSTAPMPIKAGDEVTVSILAMASPLGRGSPEGYALRHLRLRFAFAHTGGRAPFYSALVAAGERSMRAPPARAAMVSCTVDMPTTSAPSRRSMRYSARVS